MNYFFHPEAEAEFLGAIDYYEQAEQGLGYDFANEVHFEVRGTVYVIALIIDWTLELCSFIYCQYEGRGVQI